MATRRKVLLGVGGGIALACCPASLALAANTPSRYLSARLRAGRHEAALIDAKGRDLQVITLPDRGHSFAIDAEHGRAVAFGRQPGFFAHAFALEGDAVPQALPLPDDRHYYGHGAFSANGQRIYATENDFDGERGVIGVYTQRANGWERSAEFPTHGVGPHEVVLMPDGRTLCVANGGILTHPDYGKTELNLDSMKPSLVYLDATSGRLLESVALPAELHRLSIRHLAIDGQGAIWFGCQHMGPASERPALVGRHRRGQALELFAGDDETRRAMRNYVGSVAIDSSGTILATSSPVGGLVAYWDARSGEQLGQTPLPDGCGVAADRRGGHFLISDGHGGLTDAAASSAAEKRMAASPDLSWDNHLRRI